MSDGGAVSMWKGVIWPVRHLELVTADDPRVRAAPEAVRDAVQQLGGLFASTGAVAAGSWDLTDAGKVKDFVHAALAVDVKDRVAVIDLVKTYGRLGAGRLTPGLGGLPLDLFDLYGQIEVGPPQAPGDGVEAFAAVREGLATFQAAVGQLTRLKRRGTRTEWEELIESLKFDFWGLQLTLRWDDRTSQPRPAWAVERPYQVLWATFWSWATGAGEIRRCQHCGTLFQTDDNRKIYCTVLCTNRASAAASYKRRRHTLIRRKRRKP